LIDLFLPSGTSTISETLNLITVMVQDLI